LAAASTVKLTSIHTYSDTAEMALTYYVFLIQQSRVVRNVTDRVLVRIWLLGVNMSCYCFGFPHKRFGVTLTVGILIIN